MRAPPLRLRIAASPLLAGALTLVHGAAIACVVACLPGWWMPVSVSTAIAISLVFHVRRDALQRSGDAVTALVLRDEGRCELILANGDTVTGSIEGTTFATALLTVINVRPARPARPRAAVLMPDSAPAQEMRRVRVWLRFRARPDRPASGPL
jgi:toxin CptA